MTHDESEDSRQWYIILCAEIDALHRKLQAPGLSERQIRDLNGQLIVKGALADDYELQLEQVRGRGQKNLGFIPI